MSALTSTARAQSFKREPAWIIQLVEIGLVLLVSFGLDFSGDQQSYIVAAVVAFLGLVTAFLTRPFSVSALTDFARAALVVGASFGVGLTADQIALIVTFLGVLTTGIVRGQVTPKFDPVIAPGGAGAGPVRGEAGYVRNHLALAIALLLVGILLVVLLGGVVEMIGYILVVLGLVALVFAIF